MERMPWNQYFMEIASLVSERSTCIRRKVGAILVYDNRILCAGYNGAPQGITHCSSAGCIRKNMNIVSGERHELCRGLHAEQNVLVQAAMHGISIRHSTLYCTDSPCSICFKMLINAKIYKIYYLKGYNDKLYLKLLAESNIRVEKLKL